MKESTITKTRKLNLSFLVRDIRLQQVLCYKDINIRMRANNQQADIPPFYLDALAEKAISHWQLSVAYGACYRLSGKLKGQISISQKDFSRLEMEALKDANDLIHYFGTEEDAQCNVEYKKIHACLLLRIYSHLFSNELDKEKKKFYQKMENQIQSRISNYNQALVKQRGNSHSVYNAFVIPISNDVNLQGATNYAMINPSRKATVLGGRVENPLMASVEYPIKGTSMTSGTMQRTTTYTANCHL